MSKKKWSCLQIFNNKNLLQKNPVQQSYKQSEQFAKKHSLTQFDSFTVNVVDMWWLVGDGNNLNFLDALASLDFRLSVSGSGMF